MTPQPAPQPEPRYTLQEAAAELGIGPNQLFRELRRRRVLDNRNVPTWRYKRIGLLREIERVYTHPTVGAKPYSRPIVTQRGLDWLRGLLAETCAPAR